MEYKEILSGEQFQELCSVYCGVEYDLYRNPRIRDQSEKHVRIDILNEAWDNPSLVFCYSSSLKLFMQKLHYIKNPFILVSHNEDTNITDEYLELLECSFLVRWYSQNVLIQHEKLECIPIGIANMMWPHGNINVLVDVMNTMTDKEKENDFYFYFSVSTNASKREICKTILEKKGLLFGSSENYISYLIDLASYKFAICPEGNGVDCHRTWECYYLGVIPIFLENAFSMNLQKQFPCILLKTWNDFNKDAILDQYETLYMQMEKIKPYLHLSYYRSRMNQTLEYVKSINISSSIHPPMNIVYSFTGKLPSYAVDTVYQTRLFYDGPIYFIISDYESVFIEELKRLNVTIIEYSNVTHDEFNFVVESFYTKFCIIDKLCGREKLFIYSFERFFLLYNLMIEHNLENVFFMELDNLIYDDPVKWLESFSKSEIAYMFDNDTRYASGVCFIKNSFILNELCDFMINYIIETDIRISSNFLSEMFALHKFYKQEEGNISKIQLLPIHWIDSNYPKETYGTFLEYNSVFDAASMGIFIGGYDPHHTNGNIVVGSKSKWSLIDYTGYKYKWELDDEQRKIPYIYDGTRWIRINNLHIHSKNLKPYISK